MRLRACEMICTSSTTFTFSSFWNWRTDHDISNVAPSVVLTPEFLEALARAEHTSRDAHVSLTQVGSVALFLLRRNSLSLHVFLLHSSLSLFSQLFQPEKPQRSQRRDRRGHNRSDSAEGCHRHEPTHNTPRNMISRDNFQPEPQLHVELGPPHLSTQMRLKRDRGAVLHR